LLRYSYEADPGVDASEVIPMLSSKTRALVRAYKWVRMLDKLVCTRTGRDYRTQFLSQCIIWRQKIATSKYLALPGTTFRPSFLTLWVEEA